MHEIIEKMSTSQYKTCEELAKDAGKGKAVTYSVLRNNGQHLVSIKKGRYTLYRRKTKEEMGAHSQIDMSMKIPEPVRTTSGLKPPVPVTIPQVLSKRIVDITLKQAFLRQVREKLNITEKQQLDSVLADYEIIKACS